MPTPDTSSPLDVEDLRVRVQKELETFLERQQPVIDAVGDDVLPMLEAATTLLSGGKRMRPAFAYWGWRGAGGEDCHEIIPAVAALELLQACALIHDDLMDGSDTRRGGPSVHRQFASLHRGTGWVGPPEAFGAGAAILLGDLALVWADQMLFDAPLPAPRLRAAKPVYDRMRVELMAGQYLDLLEQARGSTSVERSLRVARYKAAKYTVEGPLHLGGVLADAPADLLEAYTAYGIPVGEAFQLRDDVLGVFGDPEVTGKPAGDDLREGKRTVLVAIAEERSTPAQRQLIGRHLGDARLGHDEVDELRHVISETGALEYVQSLIDERVTMAKVAVEHIPDPAANVLRSLAEAATQRVH
ncbi:MAG TPA: polyprenyl synthetase family protein [Actinomycetes bacterium]|nr:polyprenyl synthetase family protein [Actinomycetes bacterium]